MHLRVCALIILVDVSGVLNENYDDYGYDVSDITLTSKVLAYYNNDNIDNLVTLLSAKGFTYDKEVMQYFHLFNKDVMTPFNLDADELKDADPDLIDIAFEYDLPRTLRTSTVFTSDDALYNSQWNLLDDLSASTPPMNVVKLWNRGFTGSGVVVAVVDDGIDTTHVDLTDNNDDALDYDYVNDDDNAQHSAGDSGHGTWCAGTIAAAKNDHCIIGVAYNATIAAVKFIDSDSSTPAKEAMSLVHRLDKVDIYSCSWGPPDNGETISNVDRLHNVHIEALKKGVIEGRNGKGAIYIWAVGNGKTLKDDCNLDGFVSSVYTIGITSLTSSGETHSDAEECAMVMAATYASPISTLDKGDQCKTDFTGTSAATSTAAGIIALMLEANPNLTWRDVQYLIVENAVFSGLPGTSFMTNGAGKQFSQAYGFGVMDAEALVNASLTWTTVESQITYFGPLLETFRSIAGLDSIVVSQMITNCPVRSIEHVVVYINFRAWWREYTSIYLISPLKTESRLFRERKRDTEYYTVVWYFSSLSFWGEDPTGEWILTINSSLGQNQLNLNAWSIGFGGTSVQGATVTERPPVTISRTEITDTDTPVIIGASLGAAVGFILLVASCFYLIKVFAQQISNDEIETVETIQENDINNVHYDYVYR